MTFPEATFLVVVVSVGIPAARFNMTAIGLVASYFISQIFWLVTKAGMNIPILLLVDYAVIVLICAKPDAITRPYTGLWVQLYALWDERTRADKFILSLFPVVWIFYELNIDAFYRWWALWCLALLQLLAAGWEGYSIWWQRRSAKDHASLDVSLRLAWSDA